MKERDTETFTVRLKKPLLEQINKRVANTKVSRNSWIIKAIKDRLWIIEAIEYKRHSKGGMR